MSKISPYHIKVFRVHKWVFQLFVSKGTYDGKRKVILTRRLYGKDTPDWSWNNLE